MQLISTQHWVLSTKFVQQTCMQGWDITAKRQTAAIN